MNIVLDNPNLEWVPNIQATTTIVSTGQPVSGYYIGKFPRKVPDDDTDDLLTNTGETPLIVTSIANRGHVDGDLDVPSGRNTPVWATGLNWKLYLHSRGKVTSLLGSLYGDLLCNVSGWPYERPWRTFWQLRRPFLLRKGEAFHIVAGWASQQLVLHLPTGGSVVSGGMHLAIDMVGVETGKHYRSGASVTGSFSTLTKTFRNVYREDVRILSITAHPNTDPGLRFFLARIWTSGGLHWTRSERPIYMISYPLVNSQWDFSSLPAGGMVLDPGDKITGQFRPATTSGSFFGRIAWEAYQLRTLD